MDINTLKEAITPKLATVAPQENKATLLPSPVLHIELSREGNKLCGRGYLIDGGKVEVFKSEADIEAIARYLVKNPQVAADIIGMDIIQGGEDLLVGGIFDDIGSAISSAANAIAKNSVVRSITKAAKGVVTSKAVGAALGGLAVVFPPIGVPAAGAYAAANVALKYIEDGNEAISHAKKMLASGKKLSPKAKAALKKGIERKKKSQEKLKKIVAAAKNPPLKKEEYTKLQKMTVEKNKSLKGTGRVLLPPISPHEYAKVLRIVKNSRDKIKKIKADLDIPQKMNFAPRIVTKYPLGKNDPLMQFWHKYLSVNPKSREVNKK